MNRHIRVMPENRRHSRFSSDGAAALGVFAIALLVRLLFLSGSADRGWPHSVYYEGDAPEWVRWANALDRGERYEFDLPLRSPAVAYLMHWLWPGQAHAPFTTTKVL